MVAPKRKSDDMNVVAPVKNEKSTRSGGNDDSIKSDHYQNILNNRQSIQEFTEKLFGDGIRNMRAQPKQKTVTRVPRGKNAFWFMGSGLFSERCGGPSLWSCISLATFLHSRKLTMRFSGNTNRESYDSYNL